MFASLGNRGCRFCHCCLQVGCLRAVLALVRPEAAEVDDGKPDTVVWLDSGKYRLYLVCADTHPTLRDHVDTIEHQFESALEAYLDACDDGYGSASPGGIIVPSRAGAGAGAGVGAGAGAASTTCQSCGKTISANDTAKVKLLHTCRMQTCLQCWRGYLNMCTLPEA